MLFQLSSLQRHLPAYPRLLFTAAQLWQRNASHWGKATRMHWLFEWLSYIVLADLGCWHDHRQLRWVHLSEAVTASQVSSDRIWRKIITTVITPLFNQSTRSVTTDKKFTLQMHQQNKHLLLLCQSESNPPPSVFFSQHAGFLHKQKYQNYINNN